MLPYPTRSWSSTPPPHCGEVGHRASEKPGDGRGWQATVSCRLRRSVLVVDARTTLSKSIGMDASDVVVSPEDATLPATTWLPMGSLRMVSAIDVACVTMSPRCLDDVAALGDKPGRQPPVRDLMRPAHLPQYPEGGLTIIDTGSHAAINTIAVGACLETITVSPDGNYLYITHYGTGSVSAVTRRPVTAPRACFATPRWLSCSLRTAGTPMCAMHIRSR